MISWVRRHLKMVFPLCLPFIHSKEVSYLREKTLSSTPLGCCSDAPPQKKTTTTSAAREFGIFACHVQLLTMWFPSGLRSVPRFLPRNHHRTPCVPQGRGPLLWWLTNAVWKAGKFGSWHCHLTSMFCWLKVESKNSKSLETLCIYDISNHVHLLATHCTW